VEEALRCNWGDQSQVKTTVLFLPCTQVFLANYAFHALCKAHKQEAKFSPKNKRIWGWPVILHPKEQRAMPLPSLGPIPSPYFYGPRLVMAFTLVSSLF